MAVVHILRAVNTKLAEAGVDAAIGAEHLGKNAGWPRVVWVFADGDGEYGRRMNGKTPAQPGSIATRLARVNAHLYARRNPLTGPLDEDYVELEKLANRVLYSIREVIGPGSFEYEGERFPDSDSGTQVHQAGRRCILSGVFQVPVTREEALHAVWTPEEPEELVDEVEMVHTLEAEL